MKQELNEIYALLSGLSVSGDVIDVIAVVRQKLRKLMSQCGEDSSNG